ncbi:MAG TPA: efflux RND transporter periplasmic adaptor subunit [Gemmataceae bacterium]|nr:efflux RND transporter periplasmic adaptor subunit [Gemmataceae bacterium]
MGTRQHFGLVALAALAAAPGCGHGPAKPPRSAEERLPRLEVVRPLRTALLRRVELAATVEPLKRIDLCARVPGVVEHLPDDIDIGRKVKAGEVLIRLGVPDLLADKKHKEALLEQSRKQKVQAQEAQAVAEREVEESQKLEKRYQAELAYQRIKHERVRSLVAAQAQDRQLQDEALRQVEAADSAWQAAKAQIATRQAKARAAAADLEVADRRISVAEAEVGRLTTMVDFATVRAPFDGVITKRWVDPGAMIKDPAAPLLTITHLDRVRVLIDVPQKDVSLVNAREQNPNPDGQGDLVVVNIPALADKPSAGKYKGVIVRKARSLDPVTRTMRAEVELDNPAGDLHPGMYGTATVLLEERYEVLTIPATALVRRGDGKVEVFHVAGAAGEPLKGELQRLVIELGLDDGRLVEVRRGLTGNELIVLRGNGVLRGEDKVIAVPERAP